MVSEEQKQKNNRKASAALLLIAACCVITSIFCTQVIRFVQVSGSSMYPTYHDGQMLTGRVRFDEDDLTIGSVVVFRTDKAASDGRSTTLIKRIEGVPGDTLQIKGGILYRNNKKIDEPYGKMSYAEVLEKPLTLEAGQYFCMGDNREYSEDSRYFGPVTRQQIRYLVITKQK